MPTIDWDELVFIGDWSRTLDQLLQDARVAIQNNDTAARQDIQDTLAEFQKKSPPNCATLDKIAGRAIDDLFVSDTNAAITALMSRLAELKDATKLINGVTEANNQAAKDLQFTNLISALDKAKSAVNALKAIADSNGSDQNLTTRIKALLTGIEQLSQLARTE